MQVRPEEAEDFAAIRDLHLLAFAPSRTEADIVDSLRRDNDHVPGLCLVATGDDGVVQGHIAFSRARLVPDEQPILALAPMAVLPQAQNQGIGSALVMEALRNAGETYFPLVVVVGHPRFYPRFGFEPASSRGITAPFAVPPEAWMVFRLPAYKPEHTGTVAYPRAF